jgi:hypothetical protein
MSEDAKCKYVALICKNLARTAKPAKSKEGFRARVRSMIGSGQPTTMWTSALTSVTPTDGTLKETPIADERLGQLASF